jgi:hypothetical protein
VPTVVKKDTGKMSVPNGRNPQKAPLTRGIGPVVGGKCWPAQGRSGPWEEDIVRLTTFEDCEED